MDFYTWRQQMTIWMKVTKDEYELPLAVADNPRELAAIVHTTANCVKSSVCHKHKGWAKVEVDDDETD